MVSKLVAVRGKAEAAAEPIPADRVLEGAPVAETVLEYARDDTTFAGEWRASVGAWRVRYDEWEFCHMLEGACELLPDDGPAQRFAAGDSFIVEPGFSGVWRVLSPMKKRFVIRTA